MSGLKESFKQIWDRSALAGQAEWYLYHRFRFNKNKRMRVLAEKIRDWRQQAQALPRAKETGRKIVVFGMIKTWLQCSAGLSLLLDRLGNDVVLAYLPYRDWQSDFSPAEIARQKILIHKVMSGIEPVVRLHSLLNQNGNIRELPPELEQIVAQVSERDFQYSRQIEEVDHLDPLYRLRQERNARAAVSMLDLLQTEQPDAVIVPNGLILEFAVFFEIARMLGIPAVTYEFGEQKDKIWIAQDQPVMFQDTADLWAQYKDHPFTDEERARIDELYASRQNASLWQQFSRQWQEIPTEGVSEVRAKLALDDRPVVLMAVNVIGDSLTLGRQVFSVNMTEWISRTLEYFHTREDVQFLVRVHPGERYTDGPSVEDIIRARFSSLPEHFRIISASDKINTYDLVGIANLGLTYTTTVGMEMAMMGLPVIVSGNTHYRGKGFTYDPETWEEYFDLIDTLLSAPDARKKAAETSELARHYAYRFFFDYPFPTPWHLSDMLNMIEQTPLRKVVSQTGQEQYGEMIQALTATRMMK